MVNDLSTHKRNASNVARLLKKMIHTDRHLNGPPGSALLGSALADVEKYRKIYELTSKK